MSPTDSPKPAPDPVAARMRERRTALGLSLQKLASLAGLRAASHIHHVEKGEKVPSEEVAARIARALGDDEKLYRAWVRARQRGDFAAAQEAVRTIEHRLALEGTPAEPAGTARRARESVLPETSSAEARVRESLARSVEAAERPLLMASETAPSSALFSLSASQAPEAPAPAALLRVPLLREGSDPGTGREPSGGLLGVLRFDPTVLPHEEPLFRPFAYRLTEEGTARVKPRLRAGDLVIVTRLAWPILEEEIYAVRAKGRVSLSRLLWRDERLWLLSGEQRAEPEPLERSGAPPPALVGRVATAVRYGSP